MTTSQRQIIGITAAIVLIAAMVLFTGCSRQPLAPTLEAHQEEQISEPQVLSRGSLPVGDAQGTPIPMYTEARISAREGGQLVLFDVVLDVPPGALDVDTLYSIDIPDINVFFNEFGSDGLVFNKPVTVTMSYRGADLSGVDESSIRIGWWNTADGVWVDMDCELDRVNQVVTGRLDHFSAYALVSD